MRIRRSRDTADPWVDARRGPTQTFLRKRGDNLTVCEADVAAIPAVAIPSGQAEGVGGGCGGRTVSVSSAGIRIHRTG